MPARNESNDRIALIPEILFCEKELMPLKDKPFYALDEKHLYKDLLAEFLNRNG